MPTKSSKPLLEVNDRIINGSLSVYPSIIEFKNIEVGKSYEFTVTAQNLSKEPRFIKSSLTNIKNYSLQTGTEHYAPYGLDKKITIKFTPKEEKEYCDALIIKCDDDEVELPINGYLMYDTITTYVQQIVT